MSHKTFRFSYSLRTLLLFTLLCASIMALWFYWPAKWVPKYRFEKIDDPRKICFSPDNKLIFIFSKHQPDNGSWITVYDANSGIKRYAIQCHDHYGVPKFSPGGTYFFLQSDNPSSLRTYRTETGKEFHWKNIETPESFYKLVISAKDMFAVSGYFNSGANSIRTLITLPECEVVSTFSNDGKPVFSLDESKVAIADFKEFLIVPTNGRSSLKGKVTGAIPGYLYPCSFSPDATKLAVTVVSETQFFDTANCQFLGKVKGEIKTSLSNSFSPDGRQFISYISQGGPYCIVSDVTTFKLCWSKNLGVGPGFSEDSARIYTQIPLGAYDTASGKQIWTPRPEDGGVLLVKAQYYNGGQNLYDIRTGEVVLDFFRAGLTIEALSDLSSEIVVLDHKDNILQLCRQRELYTWFQLPALWMAILFFAGFVVSLRRDWKGPS